MAGRSGDSVSITHENYINLLHGLANDPTLSQLDPNKISADLVLKRVISDCDEERVNSAGQKSARKKVLFHDVLPLIDKDKAIKALKEIAEERKYDALTKSIEKHLGMAGTDCNDSEEALTEAMDALRDAYTTECDAMKDQWTKLLYAFPREFEMDKMFLDLEVIEEDVRSGEKTNTYDEIFGKDEATRTKRKKIVLEGDPGMGKTTFAHKMVQDWAKGDEWLNNHFEYVFLIRLNAVRPSDDLQSYMEEKILPNPEYVHTILNHAVQCKKPVLFVLDGYDELDKSCEKFVKFMKWGTMVRNETFKKKLIFKTPVMLITTRISHSDSMELLDKKNLTLRSLGFKNFEAVKEKYQSKIQNLSQIKIESQKELFKNPLLTGIALTTGKIPELELFNMMALFFENIVHRYFVIRKKEEPRSDYIEFKIKAQAIIGKIAFLMLDHSSIFGEHCSPTFLCSNLSYDEEEIKMVQDIGLLWPVSNGKIHISSKDNFKQMYRFPHELFKDFFAAMHMSSSGDNFMDILRDRDFKQEKPIWYFLSRFIKEFVHNNTAQKLDLVEIKEINEEEGLIYHNERKGVEVRKVHYQGEIRAAKKLNLCKTDVTLNNFDMLEAILMNNLSHENVVKFIGYVWDQKKDPKESQLWIVTEYVPGGNMRRFIRNPDRTAPDSFTDLKLNQRLWIGQQCWTGLHHIHSKLLCHRDIKPDNILVTNDYHVKLCDFEFALFQEIPSGLTTTEGTFPRSPMYRSPEENGIVYGQPETVQHPKKKIQKRKRHREPWKSEVYSMGITLAELYSQSWFWRSEDKPLPLVDVDDVMKGKATFETLDVWDNLSPEAQKLTEKAIAWDYKERPTAAEMLKETKAALESLVIN